MRNKLIEWAHRIGLAHQVAIVSDFLPVLAHGTRDCCGVAIIAGTGSSAFSRAPNGSTARCGGWGYLLGDEGSGFAIGRAALRVTLRWLESGTGLPPLARAILDAFGASSVSELTHAVYSSSDMRAKVASIAPLVFEAAMNSEPNALAIVESAARDLADLAVRAARSVALASPIDIAVSGSVLVNSQMLRDQVHTELKIAGFDCRMQVVEEPLRGCVRLAEPQFAGTLVRWDSP
jgi:N-acetylglucosamine kinase-like BadF-type ATPase